MTQLIWNDTGDRYFEVGVDRGVLYTSDGTGVAWNGLTAVTESPSGGEATPYYLDGVMYLNVASLEEFNGTIEAYTYPDEFAEYDGSTLLGGLSATQQRRKPFGLSYRTRLGNDIDGDSHGYKIHIIYNATASPTEKSYTTVSDEVDPLNFSWSFTTRPVSSGSSALFAPLAHIVIDSTKTTEIQMRFIEDYLYGTSSQPPRLISLPQIVSLFENFSRIFMIDADPVTGLSPLLVSESLVGDLFGAPDVGLYLAADGSRLVETTNDLDGGNATSGYVGTSNFDGGHSMSIYTGALIDGGNSTSIYSGSYNTGLYILTT